MGDATESYLLQSIKLRIALPPNMEAAWWCETNWNACQIRVSAGISPPFEIRHVSLIFKRKNSQKPNKHTYKYI